jgi:hypothetical protein
MADEPQKQQQPPDDRPPLLDYQPPEQDSEPWPVVFRAMSIVFAFLVFLMLMLFGFCGGLVRGCG